MKKTVRRALSRVRGGLLLRRCLSVLLATAVVSTAVIGAVSYRGPADPVEDAEAIACGGACLVGAGIVAGAAAGYVGFEVLEKDVNLKRIKKAEASETKTAIHDTMALQAANTKLLAGTVMKNNANQSVPVARSIGQNAYIRAVNNGSSLNVAKQKAREAINDFYSKKQHNLLSQWETALRAAHTARAKAETTSNISGSYVRPVFTVSDSVNKIAQWNFGSPPYNRTVTVQFYNGSTHEYQGVKVYFYGATASKLTPWAPFNNTGAIEQSGDHWIGVRVGKTQTQPARTYNYYIYKKAAQSLQDARTRAINQVENFANATYNNYQKGEISTSELVTPTLSAYEYAPKSKSAKYGTYTTRYLSMMGYDSPANLSNTKEMVIEYNTTTGTKTARGLLLTDGNPPGDGFTVGKWYNTSKIGGTQLVEPTNGTSFQLGTQSADGGYRIKKVVGTDGKTLNKTVVRYRNISQGTASIQAYQERLRDLANRQAALNARQANLTASGGGGGGVSIPNLGFGLSNAQRMILLIALGAGALILLTRN